MKDLRGPGILSVILQGGEGGGGGEQILSRNSCLLFCATLKGNCSEEKQSLPLYWRRESKKYVGGVASPESDANSGDPDQTPRSVVSVLGMHSLAVTRLGVSSLKGLIHVLNVFNEPSEDKMTSISALSAKPVRTPERGGGGGGGGRGGGTLT